MILSLRLQFTPEEVSDQVKYLEEKGFKLLKKDGTLPSLETTEDYKKAIVMMYNDRVNGWWSYSSELIYLGVFTEEEYAKIRTTEKA